MKQFFKDIFEYHHHYNGKLIDQLLEYVELISERSMPLLSHMMNAHQIWNSRIAKTEPVEVNAVYSLEDCRRMDAANFAHTHRIISSSELDRRISYQNTKGGAFENSIQEILFHIANHHTHHRGQIISDLRQRGMVPIATDYILYKR